MLHRAWSRCWEHTGQGHTQARHSELHDKGPTSAWTLGGLVSVLGTSSDCELDLLMEATSAVKKS